MTRTLESKLRALATAYTEGEGETGCDLLTSWMLGSSWFERPLAGAFGCGNRLYRPRVCSWKDNGRMRRGRGDGHVVPDHPEHGEGSSTTIRSGLGDWHSSYPLARPIELVQSSCRVVPWTECVDMRKQVAVKPAGDLRGYIILSLSSCHTLRDVMHRLLSLVCPLRIRSAGVIQSALRPFPAPALCRCPAPHVKACS